MSATKDLDQLIAMLRNTSNVASRSRTAVSPAVNPRPRQTVVSPPTSTLTSHDAAGQPRTTLSPPRPSHSAVAARQLFLSDDHLGSAEDRWTRALRHEPFTDRSTSERSLIKSTTGGGGHDSVLVGAPTSRPPSVHASPVRVHRIGTQVDVSPELDVRVVSPPRHRVKFVDPTTGKPTTAPSLMSGSTASSRGVADALHIGASASMSRLLDQIATSGKPHVAHPVASQRQHHHHANLRLTDFSYDDVPSLSGVDSISAHTSRTMSTNPTPRSGTSTPPYPTRDDNDEFVVLANIDRLQRRLEEVTRMKNELEQSEEVKGSVTPSRQNFSVRPHAAALETSPYLAKLHASLIANAVSDESERRKLTEEREALDRERLLAQRRREGAAIRERSQSMSDHQRVSMIEGELIAAAQTRHALISEERQRIEHERAQLLLEEARFQESQRRPATGPQRSVTPSSGAAVLPAIRTTLVAEERDRRELEQEREALAREQLAVLALKAKRSIEAQLEEERSLQAANARLRAEVEALASARRAMAEEERARLTAAREELAAESRAKPVVQRDTSVMQLPVLRGELKMTVSSEADERALLREREALAFDRLLTAHTTTVAALQQRELEFEAEQLRVDAEATRLVNAKRAVMEAEMAHLAEERQQLERVRASRHTPHRAADTSSSFADDSFVLAAYHPRQSDAPVRSGVGSPGGWSPHHFDRVELEETDARDLVEREEAVARLRLQNAEAAHADDSARLAAARMAAEVEWEAERGHLEAQRKLMEESRQRLLSQQRVLADSIRNSPRPSAVPREVSTPLDDGRSKAHLLRLLQLCEQQERAHRDFMLQEEYDVRFWLQSTEHESWQAVTARAHANSADMSAVVEDSGATDDEYEYLRAIESVRAELELARQGRQVLPPPTPRAVPPTPSPSPPREASRSPLRFARLLEQAQREEELRRGILCEIEDAENYRLALLERQAMSTLIAQLQRRESSAAVAESTSASADADVTAVWEAAQRARESDLRWMASQVAEERRVARDALQLQTEIDAGHDWSQRLATVVAATTAPSTAAAEIDRLVREERSRFLLASTVEQEEERRQHVQELEFAARVRLAQQAHAEEALLIQALRNRDLATQEVQLLKAEWQAATAERVRQREEERRLLEEAERSLIQEQELPVQTVPSLSGSTSAATVKLSWSGAAVVSDAEVLSRDTIRDAEQSGWEHITSMHRLLRRVAAQRSATAVPPLRSRSPSLEVEVEHKKPTAVVQPSKPTLFDFDLLQRHEAQARDAVEDDHAHEWDQLRAGETEEREHRVAEENKRYWREQLLWTSSDERAARQLVYRQEEHARERLAIDFSKSKANAEKTQLRRSRRDAPPPPLSSPEQATPPQQDEEDSSPPRVVAIAEPAPSAGDDANADSKQRVAVVADPGDQWANNPDGNAPLTATGRRAYSRTHGAVVESEGSTSPSDTEEQHHDTATQPSTADAPSHPSMTSQGSSVRRRPPVGKAKGKPTAPSESTEGVAVRKSDFGVVPHSRPRTSSTVSSKPSEGDALDTQPSAAAPSATNAATEPPHEVQPQSRPPPVNTAAPSDTAPSAATTQQQQPAQLQVAAPQKEPHEEDAARGGAESPPSSPTRKVSLVHRPPPTAVTPERLSLMKSKSTLARMNSMKNATTTTTTNPTVSRASGEGATPLRPVAHTFTPRNSRSNSPALTVQEVSPLPSPKPTATAAVVTEEECIARSFDVIADAAAAAVRLRSSLRAYATRLAREDERDRQEEEEESHQDPASPGLKFMDAEATRRVLLRLRIREERDTADTLRQSIIFGANFSAAAAAVLRVCGGEGFGTADWTPPDSTNNSRSASVVTGGSSRGSLTVAGAFENVPWVRYDELLETMRADVRSMYARVQQQRKTVGQLVEASQNSTTTATNNNSARRHRDGDSGGGSAFEAAMEATVDNLETEYRQSLSRMRFAEMCLAVLVELYHVMGQGDATLLPPDTVLTPLLLQVIQHHLEREGHDDHPDLRSSGVLGDQQQHRRLLRLAAEDPRRPRPAADSTWTTAPMLILGLPSAADRRAMLPVSQEVYDAVQGMWFDHERVNQIQTRASVDPLLKQDTPAVSTNIFNSNGKRHEEVYFVTRRQRLRLDLQHRATAELLEATRRANRHVSVLNAPRNDPLAATMRPAVGAAASPNRWAAPPATQLTRPPKSVGDLLPAIEAALAETVEFGALSAAAGTQLLTAELSMRAAAELVRQQSALDMSPIAAAEESTTAGGDSALHILVQQLHSNEALLSSRQLALDVLSRELEGLRKIVNAVPLTLPASVVLRSGGLERITRQRLLATAMREHVGLSVELAGYIANSHHRMDLALRQEQLQGGGILPPTDDEDHTDGGAAGLLRLSDSNAVEDFLRKNPSVAAKHEQRAIRGAERVALEREITAFVAAHEHLLLAIQRLNSASFAAEGGQRNAAATPSSQPIVNSAQDSTNPVVARRVDPVDATIQQLRGVGVIVYYDPTDQGAGSRAPLDASSAPGTANRRRRAATFAGLAADSGARDFYSHAYAMRLSGDETVLNLFDIGGVAGAPPAYSFALSDVASVSEPYNSGMSLKSAVSVQLCFHGRAPVVLAFASSLSQEAWLAAIVKLTDCPTPTTKDAPPPQPPQARHTGLSYASAPQPPRRPLEL